MNPQDNCYLHWVLGLLVLFPRKRIRAYWPVVGGGITKTLIATTVDLTDATEPRSAVDDTLAMRAIEEGFFAFSSINLYRNARLSELDVPRHRYPLGSVCSSATDWPSFRKFLSPTCDKLLDVYVFDERLQAWVYRPIFAEAQP